MERDKAVVRVLSREEKSLYEEPTHKLIRMWAHMTPSMQETFLEIGSQILARKHPSGFQLKKELVRG